MVDFASARSSRPRCGAICNDCCLRSRCCNGRRACTLLVVLNSLRAPRRASPSRRIPAVLSYEIVPETIVANHGIFSFIAHGCGSRASIRNTNSRVCGLLASRAFSSYHCLWHHVYPRGVCPIRQLCAATIESGYATRVTRGVWCSEVRQVESHRL